MFQEAGYTLTLRMMIAHVLACEAPIRDDILIERVARAHGFKRSGRLGIKHLSGNARERLVRAAASRGHSA